jgi:hypothetical protein
MDVMGESEVFHIPLAESDHCGLLVQVRAKEPFGHRRGRRKQKPFRYENMWRSHGKYMDFVNRSWDPGAGPLELVAASTALSSL